MTPGASFLDSLRTLIADHESDDLDVWDMIVLTQAFCLLNVLPLNEDAREFVGRKVGEAAAQMLGRVLH